MTLQPGHEFAGYRIERLLGAGGMGTVYLARHPRLPRSVALKVLTAAGPDPLLRARFEREADLAVRIDHPNVVEVYDRGEDDGRFWIAMRYVAGTDVARLIERGPAALPPRRVAGILAQAAEGLDAAHRRGLLHRDVKPANLLVGTQDGVDQVFVSDFGIARAVRDEARLTDTGAVVATLAYVAPEQIRGEPAGHRADIYALGCTLYQMLTGQVPFDRASPAAVLAAHLNDPAPRPSHAVAGLSGALDAVIARALAKDPAERFGSCRELAAAVDRALATTRPPITPPNDRKPHVSVHRPARNSSPEPGTPRPGTGYPPPGTSRPVPGYPAGPGDENGRAGRRTRAVGPVRRPNRPALTAALVGAVAALVVVAVLMVVGTLRPTGTPATATPTPATPTPAGDPDGTTTPTAAPTPVVTAWGRNNALVALFPDLLPPEPGATGYQGARCADLDVLNNGGAPALECRQDNGISYYVWSFRRGDPRRETTYTTNIDNDTTREQPWTRPSGSGRMRWSHYPGANTGMLTVSFDDPARAWVVLDISWPHYTGQDIVDQWWSTAPI
ncbi:serine/threonine-protein kinase [Nocardia carnea]|uniref:serine/threonine-protein kinase n=1 Tax=Nocardia carnea TaxID=37328 RepID=UPI00245866F1|nr:serine/threonine-protein kinase [Nocardia carnea]